MTASSLEREKNAISINGGDGMNYSVEHEPINLDMVQERKG